MAALDGNLIEADGTYTVAVIPGHRYVFAAAGTFGGGSLAIKWLDARGNAVAFEDSPLTAAGTFAVYAPTPVVQLILSGATDPAITVSLASSPGVTREQLEQILGDSVVFSGIQLSDQSDTLLPSLKISGDQNGRMIIGTEDGNVEVGSSSRFRIDTARTIEAATIVAGNAYYSLGYFQLNPDEFALNQAFRITGTVGAQASSAYAGAASFGLRPEGATAAGFKEGAAIMGAGGSGGQSNWFPRVKLVAASSGTKLVAREYVTPGTGAIMSNVTRYHASDPSAIVVGATNTNTSALSVHGGEPSATGGTNRIEVYFYAPQDAGFAGIIETYARLKLELIA
jgi:hypothetical protein